MKKFRCVKIASLILSLILLCNFAVPTTVTAQTAETATEDEYISEVANVIKEAKDPEQLQRELDELTYEIVEWREENVKHFRFADGTYSAVVFGEAVHRLNADGEWVDIDNSLSELGGAIQTNDARVKFEKKITGSETLFTLHEGSYKLSFGLEDAIKKTEATVIENDTETEHETKLQKLTSLENLSSSIIYEDILDGVDLEYVIVSNSIKENIIVKEASDIYSYTFTLALNGLDASLVGGAVVISDSKSGDAVYTIPAPYMYDASGELSYSAEYTLTKSNGNGKYELTLTADAEWVNAESRAFPVVIDPTLVDIGQTADAFVSSSAPNSNGGSEDFLLVSDTHEAYYRFATPTIETGIVVTNATLSVPYYFGVQSGDYATVNLHQVTSDWGEHTITWNTKPSRSSSCLDSKTLYAENALAINPPRVSFDVTNCFISWYDEMEPISNYGFALLYGGGTSYNVRFVPREKMQVYAQLIVNYSGTHMAEGVYAIQEYGTNTFWETYLPNDFGLILQNTTSFSSAPLSTGNLQNLFKISYRPSTNDYVIRSMLDNSLVVFPSVDQSTAATEYCTTSDAEMPSTHTWRFVAMGSYYYIVYPSNGKIYYLSSVSTENGVCLELTTNSSDPRTKWSFCQYTGNVYEDVEMKNFKSSLYVGEIHQYEAYMRSTRIGHNGPISYSVTLSDGSSTEVAEIDSVTGILTTQAQGDILIKATYPGAPWVWSWSAQIVSSFADELVSMGVVNESSFIYTDDGFAMSLTPLSNIINAAGIYTLEGVSDNEDGGYATYSVAAYYNKWYLYAIEKNGNCTYGLIKMIEQTYYLEGAFKYPGITISFVEFDYNMLLSTFRNNTLYQRQLLTQKLDITTGPATANHNEIIAEYFSDTLSDAPYLIAEEFVKKVANTANYDGVIYAPPNYTQLLNDLETVISELNNPDLDELTIASLTDRKSKLSRIPNALEANNVSAQTVVYNTSNNTINISDKNNLTMFEKYAILATHTGNVNFNSFAAEVEYHADALSVFVSGNPLYKKAIRANMSVSEDSYDDYTGYYDLNSWIVRAQANAHGEH